MTEPVQKHLTPSNFSLMIHPVGSSASLYVSASSTLMHAEVGLPSFECVSMYWLSSSSLSALLSLFADEVLRLRCDMASSVMSVIESTFLPLWSVLGLGLLYGFSSSKSSTKEQMNLWLADLKPSLLIHSSSQRQYLMASSLEGKDLMSNPSFLSSPTLVVLTRLPLTSSLMLSLPFSQYSPLKYLLFLLSFRTTAYSSFFSFFSSSFFFASAQIQPLVSLSVIFSTTETLAAALLAQSLDISSTPDSTPSLLLPTLKLTFLPSSLTSQNLPCG